MNRRDSSKKETRELILRAARALFAQKGMEECTIRDIAKKAGVSPASVMVHFKSKTSLLEEALNRDIQQTFGRLLTSMPESRALEDRLMHLFKGFLNLYNGNRDLYRALLRTTIFETAQETPRLTVQSEEFIRLVSGMIAEQKSCGIVRPEVDPEVAASSIFFLYIGALIMMFRTPEATMEQVVDFLSRLIRDYIDGIIRSGQ